MISGDQRITTEEQLRSELNALVGQAAIDVIVRDKKLTIDELKNLKRFLLNQLAPFYINADVTECAGRDAIDKMDVGYHTFLRLWQVFSYVIANASNSDAENPNSSFNQALSYSYTAWSLGMLFVFPAALGAWIQYKQLVNRRERNTIAYQQAQIIKMNPSQKENLTEEKMIDHYNDLLYRKKVVPRYLKAKEVDEKRIDTVIKPNQFANFINKKITANPIIETIEKVWRLLSDTSLIFWPAWMTAVLIIGITAASFPPALPIIVGVTLGVSFILQGIKFAYYKAKQKTEDAIVAEKKANAVELDELSRMRNELKQRLNMKQEHTYFKKTFNKPIKDLIKEPTNSLYIAAATQNKNKENVIIFLKNPAANIAPPKTTAVETIPDKEYAGKIHATLDSKIGQHLLGSKASRNGKIAVTMINAAVNNYTQAAFVLWLLSATFGALTPVAAIFGAIATVAGGGLMFSSFGGIVGALYSIRTFAEVRAKQIDFEKNIYSRLSETYYAKNSLYNGKPKYVAFDKLVQEVEEKKLALQEKLYQRQQLIRNQLKKVKSISEQDNYILNYDLKKINVYNDRYFETQQEKPSLWTNIKKGLFRTYKAVNAGQTSIFVVRSLFLAGAVLAGVCLLFGPSAGFVFIAIALTCAAIGVALKLTQLHMDRKEEHKKFFVDTIDARISYLKKKNKQLKILDDNLTLEKEMDYNEDKVSDCDNTLAELRKPLIPKKDYADKTTQTAQEKKIISIPKWSFISQSNFSFFGHNSSMPLTNKIIKLSAQSIRPKALSSAQ